MGTMTTIEYDDPEAWKRLGRAIAKQRAVVGFKSQKVAAQAAGIGETTWREIERGQNLNARTTTLVLMANVLDWDAGVPASILAGAPEDTYESDELLQRVTVDGLLVELIGRVEQLEKLIEQRLPPGDEAPDPAP